MSDRHCFADVCLARLMDAGAMTALTASTVAAVPPCWRSRSLATLATKKWQTSIGVLAGINQMA
jgi:hypothetical protein